MFSSNNLLFGQRKLTVEIHHWRNREIHERPCPRWGIHTQLEVAAGLQLNEHDHGPCAYFANWNSRALEVEVDLQEDGDVQRSLRVTPRMSSEVMTESAYEDASHYNGRLSVKSPDSEGFLHSLAPVPLLFALVQLSDVVI